MLPHAHRLFTARPVCDAVLIGRLLNRFPFAWLSLHATKKRSVLQQRIFC
jgi:hypothetical protein